MTTQELLAEPFPPEEINYRPGAIQGTRCLCLAYLDARNVMDRLDQVVSVAGWQTEFALLPSNDVTCKLSVRIEGEWVTKMDVGGPSEQPDEGDRMKAAFSDALKRAAVHFGIGRYLYSLKGMWGEYDPTKKRITKTPALPAWALPRQAQESPQKPQEDGLREKALAILQPAADRGLDDYKLAWQSISPAMRAACEKDHPALKAIAVKVSEQQEVANAAP